MRAHLKAQRTFSVFLELPNQFHFAPLFFWNLFFTKNNTQLNSHLTTENLQTELFTFHVCSQYVFFFQFVTPATKKVWKKTYDFNQFLSFFSRFLMKRILEVVVGWQVVMSLFQQWMVPSVKNSLIPFSVSNNFHANIMWSSKESSSQSKIIVRNNIKLPVS